MAGDASAPKDEPDEEEASEVIEMNEISDGEQEKEERDNRDIRDFQREVVKFVEELSTEDSSCQDLKPSEELIAGLGLKFSHQILESVKAAVGTGRGISLTREIKKAIFYRFFLYFEIRKTVNYNLKDHLALGSKTFLDVSWRLSAKFLDLIIDSNLAIDKHRAIKLTADNMLWISNVIKFKIEQLKTLGDF